MSAKEFRLWSMFYDIEPWGSELFQLNTGIIAATISNARQGRTRNSKAATPMDYMPYAQARKRRTARRMSAADMEMMLRNYAKINPAITIKEPDNE